MELDDQLAALAAGELDAADARALLARVAADPALAARLARFEQLHAALSGWDAPELSNAAIGRLDTVIDDALDQLDDAPLAAATPARGAGLRALPDTGRDDDSSVAAASAGTTADGVIDLDAARAARGLPRWVAGLGAAAAVLAVVGVGSSLLGVGSSSDEATSDTVASDMADESAEAGIAEESAESMLQDSAPAGGAQDTAATEMGPMRRVGVDIAEGELLSLVLGATDDAAADGSTTEGADEAQEPEDAEGLATCMDEALTRDSDPSTDRSIDQLASGAYAGEPAVFVVLRSFGSESETLTVFAYDPDSCTLVDSAVATP